MNELAEARTAWRQLLEAEAQIRRLDGYRAKTRAMRNDAMDWHRKAAQARDTLNRILGARA